MNPAGPHMPKVTADLVAEAAAWLAVLHGPGRTQASERGFAQWLKRSAAHARAFEEATDIWEEARNLPRPRHPGRGTSTLRPALYAAAAAVCAVSIGLFFHIRSSGVRTNIGEQRVLALEDGSRVILNTGSRVVVSYGHDVRALELKAGEALFEVARDARRPFIVTAGEGSVRALGTSFVVRREARQLTVTLVDGKVAVSPVAGADQVFLAPGERAVFDPDRPVRKDRPRLEQALAWQRREVAFDNTSLREAVAEMNRYNRKPVQVESPGETGMHVTGLFRAGDSLSFARAVAEAYGGEVVEEERRIVLR